jgi:hypothetical protein
MSPAANLVKQHAVEELNRLGDIYGFKTLKCFMLAIQMFETLDESMLKGEMRTLYRLISTIE